MAKAVKKKKEPTLEEKLEQALVPIEEQPYSVPENWCWVRLKNLSGPICDGVHFAPSYIESGIPCYSAKDIYSDEIHNDKCFYITRSDYEDMKNKINVKQNSILVTKSGSIGRSAVVDDYYEFGLVESIGVINVLQVKPYYIKRLLDYGFVYSNTYLEQYTTGTTIKHLTLRLIEKILVPLPPLAEQQRIVERIESLFAKLDEAKDKAQAVVDGFEDRKAAILHKAFTGELTAGWRDIHGLLMDEWEHAPLNTVFQLRSGSTIDISEEREYGAIPYVKVADMNLPENEIQITTSSRFVDSCPESHVIPEGSTIFPKRGGAILTNKKRYVGINKIIADLNTMAIMPIEGKAYGWYGYYWMQSVDLRQLNNGSNVPQINNKDMVKLFVPKPSIIEQKIIVSILDSVFEKEQQAKEAAEQVISQIDTMKKSILARAFRGELGTNDPADESAVEMLKRIL